MKIEIDTNKDSYTDWLRIEKFIDEFYLMAVAKKETSNAGS